MQDRHGGQPVNRLPPQCGVDTFSARHSTNVTTFKRLNVVTLFYPHRAEIVVADLEALEGVAETAVLLDGVPFDVGCLAGLDDTEASRIRHVEIHRGGTALGDAIVVDTPGLNALDPFHERVAREFLDEALEAHRGVYPYAVPMIEAKIRERFGADT